MLCPFCKKDLIKFEAKNNDNQPLEVDACPFCGGIWLDHFEANQISLKSAKELNQKFLPKEKIIDNKASLLCPRCGSQLEIQRGESIPLNCQVYRCLQCHGNWFPKGELLAFKKAQRAKLNYFKIWQIPLASAFSILLPILILAVISLSITITVHLVKKNQEQRILASELIKNVNIYQLDKSSVLLVFETTKPVVSEIEFGQTKFLGEKSAVSLRPATFHQIKIKNLLSGRKYYYQITIFYNNKKISTSPTSFLKN